MQKEHGLRSFVATSLPVTKGKFSQGKVVEDFRVEAAQSSVLRGGKRKRRYRNGTSRSCQRCYLVWEEEGCQEEAQKKKAEKKREEDEGREERKIGAKSLKKWCCEHQGGGECARRCQVDRTKDSWAKVHANLGLLTKIENEEEEEEDGWQERDQM